MVPSSFLGVLVSSFARLSFLPRSAVLPPFRLNFNPVLLSSSITSSITVFFFPRPITRRPLSVCQAVLFTARAAHSAPRHTPHPPQPPADPRRSSHGEHTKSKLCHWFSPPSPANRSVSWTDCFLPPSVLLLLLLLSSTRSSSFLLICYLRTKVGRNVRGGVMLALLCVCGVNLLS